MLTSCPRSRTPAARSIAVMGLPPISRVCGATTIRSGRCSPFAVFAPFIRRQPSVVAPPSLHATGSILSRSARKRYNVCSGGGAIAGLRPPPKGVSGRMVASIEGPAQVERDLYTVRSAGFAVIRDFIDGERAEAILDEASQFQEEVDAYR